LTDRELRARCALGLGVSLAAVAVWYLPHYDDIAHSSSQWYGHHIDAAWAPTSPIDQTIVPALTSTDDVLLEPSLASTLFVFGVLVLVASSPFLRDVRTALVLCAPTIVTVLTFWGTQTNVVPRFFSFLLVPLFVLVATGTAAIVADVRTRPRLLRTLVAVGVFAAIMEVSAPLVWAIPRLPRQAHREVAETIKREAPGIPVYAHVLYPGDLEYHLGRRVIAVYTPAAVAHMCDTKRRLAYVDQKWLVRSVTPPCLARLGTRHYRWRQYARGEAIELWLIPASR
jgi:hypothetical protein